MADPVWVDGSTPLNSTNMTKLQTRDEKDQASGYVGLNASSQMSASGIWGIRASGGVALGAYVPGDTVDRLHVLGNGTIEWSSGSAAVDTFLYRESAYTLRSNSAIISDVGFVSDVADHGGSAYRAANTPTDSWLFTGKRAGDTSNRIAIWNDGGITWGNGTTTVDTNLYRSAADTLQTDDGLWASGGIVTKTKAGIPTDSDLVTGMQQSGAMILDTTNSRIYFRVGTTWKYAALT